MGEKSGKKNIETPITDVKFSVESKSELGKFGKYGISPQNLLFKK